jgi:DNA (cytosine-5)-methyltransferase 1
MTHGSLFSGIGGFDLAAKLMGWENIFHCEINKFCQTVLKHHFPNSILYENIKETDFTKHRRTIDVLSGGFPCQPYSVAGKRKGKEDERHLWPEMLRAIREIQPTWVIGENVSGLINWNGGMVFDEVQTDLETEGYEVIPFILPAAGINAPHKRDRVWFVAYSSSNGHDEQSSKTDNAIRQNNQQSRPQRECTIEGFSDEWDAANTECNGVQQNETATLCNRNRNDKEQTHFGENFTSRIRTAVEPFDWTGWPTQSPICCRNDGLSTELDDITFSKWRNESIKAYGNAVVPQIPLLIFQAIKKFKEQ